MTIQHCSSRCTWRNCDEANIHYVNKLNVLLDGEGDRVQTSQRARMKHAAELTVSFRLLLLRSWQQQLWVYYFFRVGGSLWTLIYCGGKKKKKVWSIWAGHLTRLWRRLVIVFPFSFFLSWDAAEEEKPVQRRSMKDRRLEGRPWNKNWFNIHLHHHRALLLSSKFSAFLHSRCYAARHKAPVPPLHLFPVCPHFYLVINSRVATPLLWLSIYYQFLHFFCHSVPAERNIHPSHCVTLEHQW